MRNYQDEFGVGFQVLRTKSTIIFCLGLHSHDDDDDDRCVTRHAVFITLFDCELTIGIFRRFY